MKHHLFSRFTSVLLAVVMLAGLMGTPILATDNVLGAEPAATVEEQTAGSADESASGVDSAAAEQAEEITTDEEESASSDSSTDPETSGEEVVSGDEADSSVPAEDESDSAATSEEESTDSVEVTEPADETEAVDETDSTDETEPAEEADVELTTSVLDENGTTVANVTVEAAEGVIPEGAKLVAELLTGEKADKAAAELNEAGVEYDGYMALDIHLENDKGEEVEPNGEVRVVMVAPAALPEEADPTTVAVQHHEELDNGEVKVKQVASAADAAQPAPLALFAANSVSDQPAAVTADNGDVTAEFALDSFSTFTVTWTFGVFHSDVVVNMSAINENDGEPLNNISVSLTAGEEFNVEKTKIPGHTVVSAQYKIKNGDWEELRSFKADTGILPPWKYYYINGSKVDSFDDYEFQLICRENLIDTVDTSEFIDIDLVDFAANGDYSPVNDGHNLKFVQGKGQDPGNPNQWNGSAVLPGIVKNTLTDGYPTTVQKNWGNGNNWTQEESLQYMFDPDEAIREDGHFTSVKDANYLFTYDANSRTYSYDSAYNAARLKNDGTFKVYTDTEDLGGSPGFNPFGTTWGVLNEFFSMRMETKFYVPKDGKINGKNMVFSFDGDDDVWVFVDGVLVLDLGGIHGKVSGSIDFATGKVNVAGQEQEEDLEVLFRQAGKTWEKGKEYTLTFFYLERGGSQSNCKIEFNLALIPQDSLLVSKIVDSSSDLSSLDYQFKLTKDGESVPNAPYTLTSGGSGTTDEEGEFTLKDGQAAIFEDLDGTYTVTETAVIDPDNALTLDDFTTEVQVNGAEPIPERSGTVTLDKGGDSRTVAFTNGYIAPPSPPEQNEDIPGHAKQAVRDGDGGVYDLSLSVTGGVETEGEEGTPINVLFVLDTSGSMDWNLGNGESGKRRTAANNAITAFVGQLNSEAGFDARFALVTFNDRASMTNFGDRWNPIYWTNDGGALTGKLPTDSNGGTGYQNALIEAKETLKELDEERMDAPTVMIFLSDGEPEDWNMNNVYSTLKGIANIDYFYTVGVGPVENYTTLKSLKDNAAEGVQTNHFDGNGTTALENAFAAIKNEITYKAYSNVSIEDTLTGNVDVVMTGDGTSAMPSDFRIVVSNNGNTPDTVEPQTQVQRKDETDEDDNAYSVYTTTVTIDNTDTENKLNPGSYTLTAAYTTAHGNEPARLTLDFDDAYNLENGWTYAVHIDIQASEAAKQAYINAGYSYLDASGNPITGAGTAVTGTGTHGGKSDVGFYSNDSARLTYTNQANIRRYVEYDRPVIQLKTVPVTVIKTFNGLDAVTPPDGFAISVKDSNNKILELELKKGTNTSTTWTWQLNLLAGNYTFAESNYAVSSQDAKKNLSTVTVAGLQGDAPAVSENSSMPINLGNLEVIGSEESKSVSITNTYVDADGDLKITKTLDKLNPLKGETASFVFQVTNTKTQETYHYVFTFAAGETSKDFTFQDLPAGTYTVKELSASGYTGKCKSASNADGSTNDTISNNVATVKVSGLGVATVTFSNNSSGNKPGDNDYAYNQFTYDVSDGWVWSRSDDAVLGSDTPDAG